MFTTLRMKGCTMSRIAKCASALVVVWATLFAVLPFAFAHAHPKVMEPVPDSAVASPAKITITFSEAVEEKFSSLAVTDEQGRKINKVASQLVSGDPKTLTLPLPPLTPGGYLVHWVSVAADGHRMQGEYKFTVK
jgi:copper resistance protein C